jgi:hypothetical protein
MAALPAFLRETKRKRRRKERKTSKCQPLCPRLSARSTQAPHRHSPANPRRHAELQRVAGYPRARAHASIHLHPSAASLQRLQSAPHLPHRLRSFSSPLHSIARHTIRRPAASLLPVPVQLELRAERPRRRFTLPTEVILSPFLSLGLPPE